MIRLTKSIFLFSSNHIPPSLTPPSQALYPYTSLHIGFSFLNHSSPTHSPQKNTSEKRTYTYTLLLIPYCFCGWDLAGLPGGDDAGEEADREREDEDGGEEAGREAHAEGEGDMPRDNADEHAPSGDAEEDADERCGEREKTTLKEEDEDDLPALHAQCAERADEAFPLEDAARHAARNPHAPYDETNTDDDEEGEVEDAEDLLYTLECFLPGERGSIPGIPIQLPFDEPRSLAGRGAFRDDKTHMFLTRELPPCLVGDDDAHVLAEVTLLGDDAYNPP